MTPATQIIVLILGGLFAIAGIVLFAKNGNRGKNTIKILGTEFQLAGSSLVIFVLGCLLIFAALRLNLATGENSETVKDKTSEPSPATPQPPEFITKVVFPTNYAERVEFEVEAGRLPTERIDEFLRLTRLAYGTTSQTNHTFQVDVTIKNTSAQPILLDLNEHYFSMQDDQGRSANLIYFCCPAKAEMLSAGAERNVQLFFESSGWEGKNITARWIFFRVNGLLPVVRASWKMRPLVAGER